MTDILALLRESALLEMLRAVTIAPSDPVVMARAKELIAKVDRERTARLAARCREIAERRFSHE